MAPEVPSETVGNSLMFLFVHQEITTGEITPFAEKSHWSLTRHSSHRVSMVWSEGLRVMLIFSYFYVIQQHAMNNDVQVAERLPAPMPEPGEPAPPEKSGSDLGPNEMASCPISGVRGRVQAISLPPVPVWPFPRAAQMAFCYHLLESLEQQKVIPSWFWRLDVQNQSASWALLPPKSLREDHSSPLLANGGSRCPLACGHASPVSASSSYGFSSPAASSVSYRAVVTGFRAHPSHHGLL